MRQVSRLTCTDFEERWLHLLAAVSGGLGVV
jgi:hypothetical protein